MFFRDDFERALGFVQRLVLWVRQQLLVIICLLFLLMQFLTWRAVLDIPSHFSSTPDCDFRSPCHVVVDKQ